MLASQFQVTLLYVLCQDPYVTSESCVNGKRIAQRPRESRQPADVIRDRIRHRKLVQLREHFHRNRLMKVEVRRGGLNGKSDRFECGCLKNALNGNLVQLASPAVRTTCLILKICFSFFLLSTCRM